MDSLDYQILDAIQKEFKDAGIPTAIYYPKPLHLQNAFSCLGYKMGEFPVTESTANKIFSLPMYPYLSGSQIDEIIQVFKK